MSRHLVHIGFAKAGATFFKAWCASRDDVAFVHDGFAGYASLNDLVLEATSDARPLVRVTSSEWLATGRRPGRESPTRRVEPPSISGPEDLAAFARREDEACEAVQRRTCALLRELAPEAHVLILVRGYDTLSGSLLAQHIKTGGRAPGLGRDGFLDRSFAYVASAAHYDRVVGMYEAAFPGGVTVLPYEMLRADREGYVGALCEVAGVAYRPFDPGRVNVSPPPHALGLMRWVGEATGAGIERLPAGLQRPAQTVLRRALRQAYKGARVGLLDRVGRALRATPVTGGDPTPAQLRAAFAGRADAVARRPHVRPYAAHYVFPSPDDAAA